jgi:type I restriction enzyme M protein
MLACARRDDGRVGVVLSSGSLLRGGKEKLIRTFVTREDLIECVIILPPKLYFSTQLSSTLLILRHTKLTERQGKILFINASKEFEHHTEVKKLNRLGNNHIQKILATYQGFKNVEGFSHVVSLKEIEENDYNLNVIKYVNPSEASDHAYIDVAQTWNDLKNLENERNAAESKLKFYMKELGYESRDNL